MIYWAPFLHFYQPPTQYKVILDKIAKESYRPLVNVLKSLPNSRITINICGVLTEMLSDYCHEDVLDGMKKLSKSGQLEFVESAKFHAILPLVPEEEAKRQIELNKKTNSRFFKDAYKPRGFFLPEMCYSDDAASIISKMGYEWIIVSGVSCPGAWPMDVIYRARLKGANIKVFFRDDIVSNKISFKNLDAKSFISSLVELSKGKEDTYVITAMDAETFGHHIHNWEDLFLGEVYRLIEDNDNGLEIKAVTVSQLLKKFPLMSSKPPRPSSWSTSKEDILKGNFYPLWKDPHNKIHSLQWEHIDICFKILEEAREKKDNDKARKFFDMARDTMDKALHSCQFWWANKPKTWNENLINKGLMLQEEAIFNAYKAVSVSGAGEPEKKICYNYVILARDIAGKIRDQVLLQ